MNTALLIVGMHRSGTSALTGSLSILGVDVGEDLLPANREENEKGFFELKEVQSFHERLLLSGGRTWDTPWPLTSSWLQRYTTPSSRAQLAEILERNFTNSALWAVKDPRLCQLLPLWREILAGQAVDVAVIHIVRDPAAVAASLARRNGFPTEKSGVLWLDHNLAAERDSRGLPRAFLTYEELIDGKVDVLERLADQVGVEWPRSGGQITREIESFLSLDLDHSRDQAGGQHGQFGRWTDAVIQLQKLFENLAETGESLDRAGEAFDSLRVQQAKLVAGFDSILLEHCTHLVLGTGGLRDLQQTIDSAELALHEADVYAKQVEAEIEKHRLEKAEVAAHNQTLEAEFEKHKSQQEETAAYTLSLEAELENHRTHQEQTAQYTKSLESELENHKTQQGETARYIQELLSQVDQSDTEPANLASDTSPDEGAGESPVTDVERSRPRQ